MTLPKIVTHPLGLAGYALALVFGALAKYGPSQEWPWLAPVAAAMAFVSLLGGLLLANRRMSAAVPTNRASAEPAAVIQTSGDQSPNIANPQAPVNINYSSAPTPRTHKKA